MVGYPKKTPYYSRSSGDGGFFSVIYGENLDKGKILVSVSHCQITLRRIRLSFYLLLLNGEPQSCF